ncbi:MAG: hypothetical protein RLZZ500_793 [Bacteroidota bacterium]|jgi:exo-beta-1,3-glucanase (GH17 family)
MKKLIGLLGLLCLLSCAPKPLESKRMAMTAAEILGNPNYPAMCYGGYRTTSRDKVPTITEIKEDLRLLHAMQVKVLRTYNVHYAETQNLLEAIRALQSENPQFEMYVMLGAWIDCKNAWTTAAPIHNEESNRNAIEVAEAVRLTQMYPEIVKIIAVGNEAMVHWASAYYVTPNIILKWVNHLQTLKKEGKLPTSLWITSSDNFASWGGGDRAYHNSDLNALIQAVDYISLHTYPMHDTHYNPVFWGLTEHEQTLPLSNQVDSLIYKSLRYAQSQYNAVVRYMQSTGVQKPVHIGETGWASQSNEHYGASGSCATDELKSGQYYHAMREWTNREKISCFYFEAFDEQWKDASNLGGSENHFGLFTLNGQAKYALWHLVDQDVFKGLLRGGKPITKTFEGNRSLLLETVKLPQEPEIHR